MPDTEPKKETPETHEAQPAAPAVAPPPTANAQPTPYREDPGQTLGIIGIVANIVGITPAGIVLGIMSRNRSRAAGFPTTIGTIAMIWGIVATALGFLSILVWIVLAIMMNAFGPDSHRDIPTPANQSQYQYSDSSSI